ncbi:MAG: hypothetical protein ACU826_08190 [Gammaproteobacteria bacterium]
MHDGFERRCVCAGDVGRAVDQEPTDLIFRDVPERCPCGVFRFEAGDFGGDAFALTFEFVGFADRRGWVLEFQREVHRAGDVAVDLDDFTPLVFCRIFDCRVFLRVPTQLSDESLRLHIGGDFVHDRPVDLRRRQPFARNSVLFF